MFAIRTATALDRSNQCGKVVVMERTVPNRIREWRRYRDMSQEELAARVGTTSQSIGRYEKGARTVTIDQLEVLATALGCKPADLLPDPESSLSETERQLLERFDQLDEGRKVALMQVLDAMVAGGTPREAPKLRRRMQ